MNLAAYHTILKRLHDVQPADRIDPSCPMEVASLLDMPLQIFALKGHPLEVRVPFSSEPLWFVPGKGDVKRLTGEGINRGRIWTALELAELLCSADLTPDYVKTRALAKIKRWDTQIVTTPLGDVLC